MLPSLSHLDSSHAAIRTAGSLKVAKVDSNPGDLRGRLSGSSYSPNVGSILTGSLWRRRRCRSLLDGAGDDKRGLREGPAEGSMFVQWFEHVDSNIPSHHYHYSSKLSVPTE